MENSKGTTKKRDYKKKPGKTGSRLKKFSIINTDCFTDQITLPNWDFFQNQSSAAFYRRFYTNR